MDDILRRFHLRVEQIRTGPVLYRGDPDVPAMISQELADFIGQGVPEALLNRVSQSFLQLNQGTNEGLTAEYARAYRELQDAIVRSSQYKAYITAPSVDRLNILVDRFIADAPRSTILKAAMLSEYFDAVYEQPLAQLEHYEMTQLKNSFSAALAVNADQPSIEQAAIEVQSIINTQNSLVVAIVLRIALTPEGFTFELDNQKPYAYDRTLTSLVYMGLLNHYPPNVLDVGYVLWWSQLFSYLSVTQTRYLNIMRAAFPSPNEEVLTEIVPVNQKDVILLAGEAFAALCSVYKTEAMQQMILPRLAHMYVQALTPEEQPWDGPFRDWAWKALPAVSELAQGIMERMARWVVTTRNTASKYAAPANILAPVLGITYVSALAIYDFIDKLVEVLVYGLDKFASPFARWLKEYLYLGRAWSSVVLPGARRRPKSVWALLFVNDFTRMDPGTRFAMSCKVMQDTPPPTYAEWERRFHADINNTGLGDFELFPHPPVRPLRPPAAPLTVDAEVLALAPLFPGQARETDFMDDKLSKWVQYNVPQGIDGQWFATPERVAQSIRRYDVDRVEPDQYTTELVRQTAHALANKYPEIYKSHKYFTVEHAMRRLKWDTDMSPGLGFMGNVRTRRMLRRHGFLAAIQKVAIDRLQAGIHPGSVAHCFVKEQVVPLEKMLAGKNIRTVTAQALISNTLALPFSIELSRAPPPEAYVLNALPRSEGGYRPFFDDLRAHALTLQADASEFDSKLGPVISVEGLAELRSIGFESNPALPVITSQIRAHYFQMRHANLVDLTTGTVFNKTGGLLTGQVNTSYDNRDAFRLLIISAWAHVTGQPPSEFWDQNTLGNAGDDDAIGSDQPYELWQQVFAVCKDMFGVTVNLEQVGWDNLSLTALQPTSEMLDTAYYRAELGMPQVDYGIKTEPAKLLLTKTEFKWRTARLTDIPFRMAHVDSMVGTAYLCAYNPEIYHDLADLYKDDMTFVLLRFYEKVEVEEDRDKFGNLTNLTVRGRGIRPRYKHVAQKIDSMIKAWQNKTKWPSYQRIFNIWVRPYSVERSSIAKHYRTLTSGGPALPVAMKLLYGLVGFREALYTIPTHVVRALPEFPGADISVTLRTPDFIIERFVWLSLFKKRRAVPTKAAFLSALREGPYANAASPVDFLEHIETEHYMRQLIQEDLERLRAQAVAVTLVYSFLEIILQSLAQTPLLGIFINLYAIATRDVNRLYATANHVYWLAEGRSSSIISNLMPADPYAWMKQLAVILVSGVPPTWFNVPGLRHAVTWAPALVEAWVLAASTASPNVGRITARYVPMDTPWAPVIDNLNNLRQQYDRLDVTVVAPTGSGKSTLFVALLSLAYPGRKIWLMHPTISARDEYDNEFMNTGHLQILKRGIVRSPDAIVYSVTYGYFAQVCSVEALPTDLLLYDEGHLSTTEMWVAWFMGHEHTRILMTATPKFTIQPKTPHVLEYPGSRRFTMKMTYVNMTFDQLWTMLVQTKPHLLSRALIICPTLERVAYVRNTLSRLSYASSELSRDHPVPSSSGIIVATSIADQALTIQPPPTTVIDLGTMLQIEQINNLGQLFPAYKVTVIPVSVEVAAQRAGRGGRASNSEGFGIMNAPRSAHKPPTRYPTVVYLNDDVSDAVLLAFGLRNPLTKLQAVPGLLQFVRVAEHVVGIANGHDAALALICLLYLSSGSDFDVFANEVLTAKFAGVISDALRVYAGQVALLFPDLDYMLGDVGRARLLLESGTFEAVIGTTTIPVAAFVFQEGWLVPAGCAIEHVIGPDIVRVYPSTLLQPILRGVKWVDWSTLLANFRVEGNVRMGDPFIAHPLTAGHFGVVQTAPSNVVSAETLGLYNAISRLGLSRPNNSTILYCAILPTVNHPTLTNLVVTTTGRVVPLRRTAVLDISDQALTINSALAFAVIVATALDDNQYCLFGDPDIIGGGARTIQSNYVLVRGPPNEVEAAYIPPRLARRVFANAGQALTSGDIAAFMAILPLMALDLDTFNYWQAQNVIIQMGGIVGSRAIPH